MLTWTKQDQTKREREAKKVKCAFHPQNWWDANPIMAGNFCCAWIKDGSNDGVGRECHTPICRNCAEIRLQIWLCPKCQKRD